MTPRHFRQRQQSTACPEPYDSLNPRMRIGHILNKPLMLAGRGARAAGRRACTSSSKVGLGSTRTS